MASEGTGVDVLENGQFLHEPEVLPERSDLPALGWAAALQVVSSPEHTALIRGQAAVAESDQAGLAGPAPPQQDSSLPMINGEVEGLEPTGQPSPAQLQHSHQRILPS